MDRDPNTRQDIMADVRRAPANRRYFGGANALSADGEEDVGCTPGSFDPASASATTSPGRLHGAAGGIGRVGSPSGGPPKALGMEDTHGTMASASGSSSAPASAGAGAGTGNGTAAGAGGAGGGGAPAGAGNGAGNGGEGASAGVGGADGADVENPGGKRTKYVYEIGKPIIDHSRLQLFKPTFALISLVLAASYMARKRSSDVAATLRYTDAELSIMSTLIILSAGGAEAILTRPALDIHRLSFGYYIKLLPWSLCYVGFCVCSDVLVAWITNGAFGLAYLAAAAVGVLGMSAAGKLNIGLSGKQSFVCFAAAVLCVALFGQYILDIVPLPGNYVPFCLAVWLASFLGFFALMPDTITSSSSDVETDTFAHVNSLLSGWIAFLSLLWFLPEVSPMNATDAFQHTVWSGFVLFVWAFWSRTRFTHAIIAFTQSSSRSAGFFGTAIVASAAVFLGWLTGLMGNPLPYVAASSVANGGPTLLTTVVCAVSAFVALNAVYLRARSNMYLYVDEQRTPFYIISLVSIADYFRMVTCGFAWLAIRGAAWVLSQITPPGLGFFACAHPVANDPGMLVGVCFLTTPSNSFSRDGTKPGHFVFNAGHLSGLANNKDWMQTASSTAAMLKQFTLDPDFGAPETGFVGNLVAEFPVYASISKGRPWAPFIPSGHRQYNISGWKDEEAAYAWYKKNNPHKDIVDQYHNKGLESFAAMLTSLQPKRLVYQNRCRVCHRMVHGWPEVHRCPDCEIPLNPMPLF